jgi:hypothetical protein
MRIRDQILLWLFGAGLVLSGYIPCGRVTSTICTFSTWGAWLCGLFFVGCAFLSSSWEFVDWLSKRKRRSHHAAHERRK